MTVLLINILGRHRGAAGTLLRQAENGEVMILEEGYFKTI
jgi:hypothetical protein